MYYNVLVGYCLIFYEATQVVYKFQARYLINHLPSCRRHEVILMIKQ